MISYQMDIKFGDWRIQILESVQASLLFLMVHSVWFRMKALREGERFFNKVLVTNARKRTLIRFFLFVLFYIWFFSIMAVIGYLLRTD